MSFRALPRVESGKGIVSTHMALCSVHIHVQALQMVGEGNSDFQGLFMNNPPPGGFYDPFTITGGGTYMQPEV